MNIRFFISLVCATSVAGKAVKSPGLRGPTTIGEEQYVHSNVKLTNVAISSAITTNGGKVGVRPEDMFDVKQTWSIDTRGSIKSVFDSDICLEAGTSIELKEFDKVHVKACNAGSVRQQWKLLTNGKIRLTNTPFYLGLETCDVSDVSQRLVLRLEEQVGACAKAQEWIVSPNTPSTPSLVSDPIINAQFKTAIALPNGPIIEGIPVAMVTSEIGNTSQLWSIDSMNRIRSEADSTYCLEADLDQKVYAVKCNEISELQRWSFLSDGKIKVQNRDFYLGVANCGKRQSALEPQELEIAREKTGICGDAQRWNLGTSSAPESSEETPYFSSRTIDDIFIISTHNSLALPNKVTSPSQEYGLARQFVDGIRGFNFNLIQTRNGIRTNYGLTQNEDYNPLKQISNLKAELDLEENKDEFIIIQLNSELQASGNLMLSNLFGTKLVKNFDPNTVLGQYISQGQQVLIIADKNADPTVGIHDKAKLISENESLWVDPTVVPPVTHSSGPVDPTSTQKYMRNMNYYVTKFGESSPSAAYSAHDVELVLANIMEYEAQPYSGGVINSLMIDFYTQGEADGKYAVLEVQDLIRQLKL